MKTTFLFLLGTIAFVFSYSQNLILNPSFEIPQIANDCPTDLAQFDKLETWQSRTQIVGSGGGTLAIHSPDWLKQSCVATDPYGNTLVPHTGSSASFVSPEELAQQNLSGALNEGLYFFEGYVKLFSTAPNPAYNYSPNHTYYFRLRFAYNEMTYQSENSENDAINCTNSYRHVFGQNLKTVLIPIQTGVGLIDNWQKISLDNIKIFNFGYDWVGFDMVVYDSNGERICANVGIQVDDLSLIKDCCGDFIVYQNFNELPVLTQRRKYIKAGADVGAPHQSIGPVVVQANQNVKFSAGQAVYIEPGFFPESGANYVLEIDDCGPEEDPLFYNYDINLDFVNQGALLDCSNSYQQPVNGFGVNAAFYSKGGGWYRIQLFNNIGTKVFDDMGPINSLIQLYWNGTGTFTSDLQDEVAAQLFIYNCYNYILETYSITYEYLSGCDPSYKKEYEVQTDYTCNQIGADLYPNPTTDFIKVVPKQNNIEVNELTYTLFDINSQNLQSGFIENGRIDASMLPSGKYFITINNQNGNMLKKFKIIKL